MRSALVALAVVVTGCRAPATSTPSPSSTPTTETPKPKPEAEADTETGNASSAPIVAPEPLTLQGDPLQSLPVEGHADAVVSLPLGATVRRPIVLAVHGNYDRPEWQCDVWRRIVGDRAFVLCPRGIPRDDSPSADDVRFTFASSDAMAKELDAAIAALRARFPDFVDDGPMIYTGFSLGAITGVPYLLRDPERTPRAVLTEGSHDRWTSQAVAAFAKKGGVRVLFACGQPSCASIARWPAKALESKGVPSKVVLGPGVGHGYDGAVADAIAAQFDWLVDGDARFSAP